MPIKKITIEQLRTGMFVHEFCGSWMDHPFWRSRFLLTRPDDLRRIVEGGVRELWIDTEKGANAEGGIAREQVEAEIERELEFAASRPFELEDAQGQEQALASAAALCRRSVPQIASLFGEARLGRAVSTAMCESLVAEISDSVLRNPGALISVARLKRRDEYTYMHSVAVCALMLSLGHQMGLKDEALRMAGLAGMLHDLGKGRMPLSVLNKPGKLTQAEFDVMKTHPELGHAMLVAGGSVGPEVLDVCLHHHEKYDGSGYPHRLAGEQISLYARMGAVCDVYDAVTSVRPYKTGWDPAEALRAMAQWKGHFEPRILHAFVKAVGIYPVGSLVRLQSGRLAVVMEQSARSLLTPRVKVFFSTRSNWRIPPEIVDLSSREGVDRIVACESPDNWPFKDLDELWAPVEIGRQPSRV